MRVKREGRVVIWLGTVNWMRRPLGVFALASYFCVAASVRGFGWLFGFGSKPHLLTAVLLALDFLIAIGLFTLARWGWVLLLIKSVATAAYASYAFVYLYSLSGEIRITARFEVDFLIYNLMIAVYLLDAHVRHSFFRSTELKPAGAP